MGKSFENPLLFADHLVKVAGQQELSLEFGLKAALKLIQSRAKEKIGHYQPGVGRFASWNELSPFTKKDRVIQGYPENEPLLREGDLRDSIVTENNGLEGVAGSKSEIAAVQEYGRLESPREPAIPPRAYIGPAAYELKEKIREIIGLAVFSTFTANKKLYEFTNEE